MTRSFIVPTDLAVTWLVREGVDETCARRFIYNSAHRGRLTNWGGLKAGQAKWDLREIRALMWPRTQDEHPLR